MSIKTQPRSFRHQNNLERYGWAYRISTTFGLISNIERRIHTQQYIVPLVADDPDYNELAPSENTEEVIYRAVKVGVTENGDNQYLIERQSTVKPRLTETLHKGVWRPTALYTREAAIKRLKELEAELAQEPGAVLSDLNASPEDLDIDIRHYSNSRIRLAAARKGKTTTSPQPAL